MAGAGGVDDGQVSTASQGIWAAGEALVPVPGVVITLMCPWVALG